MKIIRRISSIILGSVFFVAGLMKLMDPLGTSLIVDEYFNFFHMGFLSFSSMFCGEAIALFETVLGAALVTGVWRGISGILSAALLFLFTVITFILLIFNPDMDCGCFGQAVHLTHLQSFVKNIILCVFWVAAFVPFNNEGPRKLKYAGFAAAALSSVAFMLFFLFHLPFSDHTPFAPGSELAGEYLSFEDSSPVLSFSDEQGEYADSLALQPHVIVFSIYNPDKLSQKDSDRIEAFFNESKERGFTPLALVAGSPERYPGAYYADRRMLMSLNRANGGATYIADGQIVAKWTPREFPGSEEISEMLSTDPTEVMIARKTPQRLKLQGFLLYAFAVMLLL